MWIKLWVDAATDFKVRRIPFNLRWCFPALLLLAKRSPREGYLEISLGVPYSTEELAQWCGCKSGDILIAINALVTVGILIKEGEVLRFDSWEKRQYNEGLARVRKYRTNKITEAMKQDCNVPVTECNGVVEENRIEEKREEKKERKRFTPPTLEEVTEYCKSRNNTIDPIMWHSKYVSNGWMVGRSPMKDWKATIVTWERRNF
jgi:hypothetical protein